MITLNWNVSGGTEAESSPGHVIRLEITRDDRALAARTDGPSWPWETVRIVFPSGDESEFELSIDRSDWLSAWAANEATYQSLVRSARIEPVSSPMAAAHVKLVAYGVLEVVHDLVRLVGALGVVGVDVTARRETDDHERIRQFLNLVELGRLLLRWLCRALPEPSRTGTWSLGPLWGSVSVIAAGGSTVRITFEDLGMDVIMPAATGERTDAAAASFVVDLDAYFSRQFKALLESFQPRLLDIAFGVMSRELWPRDSQR